MNTRFDAELSRLAFEERMVEICEDTSLPLLERVRLLGILGERLDVFFMTRVGRLKQLQADGEQRSAATAPPDEQLRMIATESRRILERIQRVLDEVLALLAERGVVIEDWADLDEDDRSHLRRICGSKLDGLISPIIVDANHAFVHVRNLRPALVAEAKRSGEPCLVVVELPADLPRLVPIGRDHRFVPLEQIIATELPTLCSNLEVGTPYLFRVTRNAHTELDDDDDVLRDFEQEIVSRPFQDVIRLEVEHTMPQTLQLRLRRELQEKDNNALILLDEDVYHVRGLLDLTALDAIADIDLPDLKSTPIERRETRVNHVLSSATHDALLHFPFDDYETSIGAFLKEAARHPKLEAIQTTIYRTDEHSDVVAALREACRRGAKVDCVV
ncbi:MAG TPA: hypothetical protein VEB19_14150, partial [Gemmatimonadaceae bacterium]|nr:hypothetical protein [Gemmatimonadaceae bacterium]